jgi:hypothetical protein
MGMFSRASGGQQARLAARQRGVIQTGTGYTSFPWNTHPDDQRVRVFADGPFDRAWEGVQKVNLITSVGVLRAARYDPNSPVFNFETKQQTPRVQQNNWAAFSFGGGPASIAAQEQAYQESGQSQSFLSMVLGRLRGGR